MQHLNTQIVSVMYGHPFNDPNYKETIAFIGNLQQGK